MVVCAALTRHGRIDPVRSHAVWALHRCALPQRANASNCSTCRLCRAVPRESPFFLRARVVLADIYLTHKHDRAAYARCYSDLVDKHGDFDSYRLYGEALLHIQEPEKAIKVGEAAHPILCTGSKCIPSIKGSPLNLLCTGLWRGANVLGRRGTALQEPERAIKVVQCCTFPALGGTGCRVWEQGASRQGQAPGFAPCWGLQRCQRCKSVPGMRMVL